MPFGGNDWLALTQEPTLELEIPICDAHHHFWDFRSQSIPYQRYLLHELAADVNSGHNVRSTVFLEARSMYRAEGPEEMRPVGEVGIRHGVTWDPHPGVQSRETERKLADEHFRAGARVVARMGLSLDTFLYFPHLPELADFARVIPELTIILNHIGGLMRVGPYANRDDEVLPTWRSGIAAVAACPNVTMKLGGMGMPWLGFDWHTRSTPIGSEELAEGMGPFMTYCIEQFGPERCMFESNFPPDKVSFSYNVMYNAFKRLSKGYSAAERAAMFHDTATRVYRIDV